MSGDSRIPIDFHPLTMSTLEIAGLAAKAHKHVLADARKMLLALSIQPAEFSARYKDAKGEEREVINLPKRECLILVSGYSIEMRSRIIDRWIALETALQDGAPSAEPRKGGTLSEALRMINAAARIWDSATLRELWLNEPSLPKVPAMFESDRQLHLFPREWSSYSRPNASQ